MKIITVEPLTLAPLPGRLSFPEHTLTMVIKGLFRLEEGRLRHALPDDDLAFPTGDMEAEGVDTEAGGAIRYPSDFVHYKPRADLLLVGQCRPPDGRAVGSCPVAFQVGPRSLELLVSGDRWWSGEGGSVRMTEPVPFTEMELGWERAYGGPRCADNPVGRGHEPIVLSDGREAWPLPNIEFPDQRVGAPEDRPAPAGFGPIPITWEPRGSRSGTYDADWLGERWPWFPADLDWSLFNAGPPGLDGNGYLSGDEEVHLRNVVAGVPRFSTRLPGIRVRCFVNALPAHVEPPPRTALEREEWEAPEQADMDFREVPLSLDTLWIDAENGLVALVWRGHTPIRSEEVAEIREVFVHTEKMTEAPASIEACRSLFLEALVDEEDPGEVDEQEAPLPLATGPGEDSVGADDDDALSDPEDPDPDPELPFDPETKLRADLEAMGLDLDNPPKPTQEERERAKQVFRELGRDDLVALLEIVEGEEEQEETAPEVAWSREMVIAAHEAGDSLEGLDLRGLDLSGLDLSGLRAVAADFTGARMRGVRLTGADLSRAKLSQADLTEATMGEAVLLEADLTGARLHSASAPEADFSSARLGGAELSLSDLSGAVLEGCDLRRTVLTGVRADDAVFVEADLTEANLIRGSFAGGDFTGAVMSRVDAREALFRSAEFFRVRAPGAMLAGADLEGLRAADALDFSEANLSQVRASDSNWSGATLKGAILAWAVLDGADFSGANLQGADFYAAHLKGARFSKADMLDARLSTANAFEATFDGADLARADLRGGNFYAAEFLDARFWETLVDGANLKMTKHG